MSIEIAQLGKMRGKSRENRKKVSRETKKGAEPIGRNFLPTFHVKHKSNKIQVEGIFYQCFT